MDLIRIERKKKMRQNTDYISKNTDENQTEVLGP